jgi:hypothetical protein
MKKASLILTIFSLVLLISLKCTSERLIIRDTEPCRKYLELKEKIQYASDEEKPILEARLEMLKASCAHSGDGPDGANRRIKTIPVIIE